MINGTWAQALRAMGLMLLNLDNESWSMELSCMSITAMFYVPWNYLV
jgi:hypothetical protein